MPTEPEQRHRLIVEGARLIRDREVVFVGMRLPLLAFALAQRLHAPHAVALFECGLARTAPARAPLVTMADPANGVGADWAGPMTDLMGLLAQGRVDLGLIGGAQVDRYANVNSSYIGGYLAPDVRLPGSGGAADIASFARRTVILIPHERRRLVAEVDYLTSPGYGSGPDWREGVGLPRRSGPQPFGGPAQVVTTLGRFRVDPARGMVLTHLHPGVTLDRIRAESGFAIESDGTPEQTPLPTAAERRVLAALLREENPPHG